MSSIDSFKTLNKLNIDNQQYSFYDLNALANHFRFDLITIPACKKILLERNKRIKPLIDNKIITSWNAITLIGLLNCYQATNDNKILELAINSGAEDCSSDGSFHQIITVKENFYKVKIEIEKKIESFISANIEWLPMNKITLDREKTKSVLNFLETLEDDDDVQNVYANLEINNNFLDESLKT